MLIKPLIRQWANYRLRPSRRCSRMDTLRNLLKKAAQTRFGRRYDFEKILADPRLYQAFCERVPVGAYDDWVNWLDVRGPGRDGQTAPLIDQAWPGSVNIFCLSSGTTTGRSKYIPYSQEMAAVNRRAALDFFACVLRAFPQLAPPFCKTLYMSGSTNLTKSEQGVLCGDMSAITKYLAPPFLQMITLPPPHISAMEPWSDRLNALARLCLQRNDIGVISGIPIWQLSLLEKIVQSGGKSLQAAMPRLKVLIHGGMSIEPYRAQIQALLGENVLTLETYAASETGIAAFQIPGETGMRFWEHYQVFYEFEHEDGRITTAAQIEPMRPYRLIVSSCSGLWRYKIGDCVVFSQTEPLILDHVLRDKTTSAFDEKITEKELERAMLAVKPSFGDFSMGPLIKQRRHVWFVGAKQRVAPQWLNRLDQALRAGNQDYDDYRGDGRIQDPLLVLVRDRGQFLRLLGRQEGGQRKFPRLLSPEQVETLIEQFSPHPTLELIDQDRDQDI